MMDHNRDTWSHHRSVTSTKPDDAAFAAGFSDESSIVRANWAKITAEGFLPSAEQSAAGLNNTNCEVRYVWASRTDYTPTHEQVETMLKSEGYVRGLVSRRTDIKPTKEQLLREIEEGQELYAEVLKNFLINKHCVVDEEIATLICDKFSKEDRQVLIFLGHNAVISLTNDQYTIILSAIDEISYQKKISRNEGQYIDLGMLRREITAKMAIPRSEVESSRNDRPRL